MRLDFRTASKFDWLLVLMGGLEGGAEEGLPPPAEVAGKLGRPWCIEERTRMKVRSLRLGEVLVTVATVAAVRAS